MKSSKNYNDSWCFYYYQELSLVLLGGSGKKCGFHFAITVIDIPNKLTKHKPSRQLIPLPYPGYSCKQHQSSLLVL